MKISDLLITGAVAVSTMICTLAILGPTSVDAAGPNDFVMAPLPQPGLTVDGVTITVEPTTTELEPGEKPTARITVTNDSDRVASLDAKVSLLVSTPGSPFSRMVSLPKQKWSKDCPIVLKAGETKTLTLQADATVPDKNSGQFLVTVGEKSLASVHFARPGQKPQIAMIY